jgi:hypothetical protein
LDTCLPETVYIREQGFEDPMFFFEARRSPRAKKLGKPYRRRLHGIKFKNFAPPAPPTLTIKYVTRPKLAFPIKVKVPPNRLESPEGVEVQLYTLLTSAVEGGGWSAPRPGRFTAGKDPVPIVPEAGWVPGPVWTYTKNLAPTGIRSPDRPARSHSLY